MSARQKYRLAKDALILHCPWPQRHRDNPFHHEWEAALETYFSDEENRGRFAVPEDLTVITYNTRDEESLLERGFRHPGLRPPIVLGKGLERWGWDCKITLVRDYLASGRCGTPYVLCLDADDILLVGDPALILPRFREAGGRILFCGTRGNQPPSEECWEFENSVPEYVDPLHRHLNAGAYVAEVHELAERLGEIAHVLTHDPARYSSAYGFDDQLAWRHLHRAYYPAIRVDADCRIFLRFDEDR